MLLPAAALVILALRQARAEEGRAEIVLCQPADASTTEGPKLADSGAQSRY